MTEYLMDSTPRGKGELREEMIGILARIAREDSARARGHQTAVTAAARVLEAIDREQGPERKFLDLFGGDRTKALAWLDAHQGSLRAFLQAGPQESTVTEYVTPPPEAVGHDTAQAEQGQQGKGDEWGE